MPVRYRIDPSLNLLFYGCFGVCTGAEFFQAERKAFQDELRKPDMLILFDVRTADEVDFSLDDLKHAVAFVRGLNKQNHRPEKTAVLSTNSVAQIFMKSYGLLLSDVPLEFRVFRTMEDAAHWLGLTDSIGRIREIKNSLHEDFLNQ